MVDGKFDKQRAGESEREREKERKKENALVHV